MSTLVSIVLSPATRWLAVLAVLAALTAAWVGERRDHRETQNDLTLERANSTALAGRIRDLSEAAGALADRNRALVSEAAAQCGTGQTAAFERGRAFGRAETEPTTCPAQP